MTTNPDDIIVDVKPSENDRFLIVTFADGTKSVVGKNPDIVVGATLNDSNDWS